MKTLEEPFNSSLPQLHNIGKGNIGRPPNKACRYCCRKKVYPEKCDGDSGKWWKYPSSQECFDCVMARDGLLNYFNEQKARKRENALRFPLTIHDTSNKIFVGQYNSRRKTQQAINRYQSKRRKKAKLSIIHYIDSFEFTDRFKNTD